jgi:DNA-binding NarL/FixJ family response regulator
MRPLTQEKIGKSNFRLDPGHGPLCLILLHAKDEVVESDEIRIILVDNRASNRRGVKALLAFEPRISVVGEAGDGTEAVQLVGKDQPDLVLMDIHMPVMDGLKATQLIKTSWPDIKVVLYSVYPGYQEEARLAGADHFVIKGSPNTPLAETILSFFPSKDINPN